MLQLTKLDGRTLLVDPNHIALVTTVIVDADTKEHYTMVVVDNGRERDIYRVREPETKVFDQTIKLLDISKSFVFFADFFLQRHTFLFIKHFTQDIVFFTFYHAILFYELVDEFLIVEICRYVSTFNLSFCMLGIL